MPTIAETIKARDEQSNNEVPQTAGDVANLGTTNSKLKNLITGELSQLKEYWYNELAADKAFEREMKAAKYQNEWNSEQEQLKRWLAAGGTVNSFFASKGGSTAAAQMSGTQGGGATSTAGIESNAIAQMANATNTATKTFWEVRKTKAEAQEKEINNGTLKILNETKIAEITQHIKLMEKQGKYTETQTKQILELLPLMKEKTEGEIQEIKEKTNFLIEQQKSAKAQRSLWNKQGKLYDKQATVAQYTANKLQWEQLFRDTWGIDPSQHGLTALITLLAQGKGQKVLDGLFSNITGETETPTGNFLDSLKGGFNILGQYMTNPYFRRGFQKKYMPKLNFDMH